MGSTPAESADAPTPEPGSATLTYTGHEFDDAGYAAITLRGEREDGEPWIGQITLPVNGLELLRDELDTIIKSRA
jgi:hypothetical protein